jgi:thiol:disulfide interchange protein DsbD
MSHGRSLVIGLAFVLLGCGSEKARLPWAKDFKTAQAEAKKGGKLLLVDFYSDLCPACEMLDSDTFSKQKTATLLQDYVLARVNVDKDEDPATKHSIEYFPTLIFFGSDGKEIDRSVGYVTYEELAEKVEAARAKIKPK